MVNDRTKSPASSGTAIFSEDLSSHRAQSVNCGQHFFTSQFPIREFATSYFGIIPNGDYLGRRFLIRRSMPRSQHSARYKKFCALLEGARQSKGLTQAEVARRLGKPQSFIAKYEAGERRLDVVEFLEVAEAIGVPMLKILRGL
jgi:hypothetical protein